MTVFLSLPAPALAYVTLKANLGSALGDFGGQLTTNGFDFSEVNFASVAASGTFGGYGGAVLKAGIGNFTSLTFDKGFKTDFSSCKQAGFVHSVIGNFGSESLIPYSKGATSLEKGILNSSFELFNVLGNYTITQIIQENE